MNVCIQKIRRHHSFSEDSDDNLRIDYEKNTSDLKNVTNRDIFTGKMVLGGGTNEKL
jgi:hypothetical protein